MSTPPPPSPKKLVLNCLLPPLPCKTDIFTLIVKKTWNKIDQFWLLGLYDYNNLLLK